MRDKFRTTAGVFPKRHPQVTRANTPSRTDHCMGDQIGATLDGTLYFVPKRVFDRVRALPLARHERARIVADLCRINVLYMIARAGSGHIGSSFSSLDIMSWLFLE